MNPYKHQFISALVAYAVQRDVKAELLCDTSGINVSLLKKKTHSEITEKNLHDLWHNAVELTNDPLFGLHLGESLQLSALGVVGQVIQSSKTIGEALVYACKAIEFITDVVSMDVTKKKNRISVCFNSNSRSNASSASIKQFGDFFMVFTIHELDGLTFQRLVPLRVTLPVVNKEHAAEYERVLRCKPKSGDNAGVDFDASFWDEPIITANYEIQKTLLAMQAPFRSSTNIPLREKITAYLKSNAFLGTATIEQIASNFNSTPRTLQRRLQEEGVTFRDLTEEVRKSLALRYLTVENQPIKEVAFVLGYNDVSALSRAFKRWTGKTPAAFAEHKRRR